MANRVTESFTGAAGTNLTARAGETGANWSVGAGFTASATPVIDSTGGRIMKGSATNSMAFASGLALGDGEISALTVDTLSVNPGVGVLTRASPNLGGVCRGYMGYFGGGNVTVMRLDNASTFTTLLAASPHALPIANGDIISIQATGTGASVALDVKHNGVTVATVSDASASRITTFGTAAMYLEAATQTTGAHPTFLTHDDSVAAASMNITGPADGTIVPLSGGTTGTATLALAGNYSGTAPDQWRLVDDGGSTSITGFDWQAFAVAPTAGAFAQTTAPAAKKAGWYNFQVRNSAAPGTVYTSGKVAPGAHVVLDGQSNAYLWFSTDARGGDGTLTPSPLLRVTGKQAANAWVTPSSTMNAAIACGNALVAAIGCPVALIDGSWDASGLTIAGGNGASGPGGQWVPTTTNAYASSLSAITAAGGKVLANVWIQGEGDAGYNVTQAAYYGALGTMIAQRRTDLAAPALPYVMVTLGSNTVGMSDTAREAIKLAQVQKCADANVYRVDRMDLPLSDGVHHNPTGYTALGKRVAQAVLASVGLVTEYRGPSIASAAKVSASVFDVALTHHMGSDFTPTSAITGFRVTDPGAADAVIAVSTAARQSATAIRLTLASAPVGLPKIAYLHGSAPTLTGVVLGNGALTLPLEYNAGVVSAAALATTATFSVVDASGAPVTGVAGLDYAFYDSPRISSGAAPVKYGTTLAISGGIATIDITGATTLAPGSTGRAAWGDSGLIKAGTVLVVVT